ncbi:Phosphoinositide phospholipase C [Rhynchospora pubera]|uniref:Phosphoinositide phospholipase C n=1 Tax=Rhynchospora pubera TaxID=906938 RepID=A0AAV8F6K7_9POAL|nr:Phosphoinositide phospholipase C [Rhynchospora pubera]
MYNYRICYCFRLRYRPASNEPSDGLKEVYKKYAGADGAMGLEQLQRFMSEVQGEADAVAAAQTVMERSKEFRLLKRKGISLDAFFHYLSSNENSPLLPGLHQDMTAPLSHYFIFTGHNSYLTGNQLTSDCSDQPIRKALIRGVRGIELDVWPSSNHDDINVLHGRTLTTPVKLIDCIKTIREYAFASSPYPLIITLEDHLNTTLRAKLTSMMNEIFGDLLYVPNTEHIETFPSPEDLKMKILVSTKPPTEYLEEPKMPRDKDTEAQGGAEDEAWGEEILHQKPEVFEHKQSEHYQDEEDHDDIVERTHEAADYRHLISIPARKKIGGLTDTLKTDTNQVGRLSLSEQVFEKATIHHGNEIIRFTKNNLLRIYPRGARFASSNYNPMHGWMYGAQMVAFNMQGYARSLWVMQGMFRANGGYGYVKKPDFLLDTEEDHIFDPKAELPVKKILKVKVFMGDGWRFDYSKTHFDRYSPPDFYTRVGIAGVPADSRMERTNAIEDNWTPMWDKEFEFKLRVPELAVLRIEVHEYDMSEKDDFAGQICLPVWELQRGIRAIRLCDRKGDLLPSVRLLMQFDFA